MNPIKVPLIRVTFIAGKNLKFKWKMLWESHRKSHLSINLKICVGEILICRRIILPLKISAPTKHVKISFVKLNEPNKMSVFARIRLIGISHNKTFTKYLTIQFHDRQQECRGTFPIVKCTYCRSEFQQTR